MLKKEKEGTLYKHTQFPTRDAGPSDPHVEERQAIRSLEGHKMAAIKDVGIMSPVVAKEERKQRRETERLRKRSGSPEFTPIPQEAQEAGVPEAYPR
jgi:hypothetical protein